MGWRCVIGFHAAAIKSFRPPFSKGGGGFGGGAPGPSSAEDGILENPKAQEGRPNRPVGGLAVGNPSEGSPSSAGLHDSFLYFDNLTGRFRPVLPIEKSEKRGEQL